MGQQSRLWVCMICWIWIATSLQGMAVMPVVVAQAQTVEVAGRNASDRHIFPAQLQKTVFPRGWLSPTMPQQLWEPSTVLFPSELPAVAPEENDLAVVALAREESTGPVSGSATMTESSTPKSANQSKEPIQQPQDTKKTPPTANSKNAVANALKKATKFEPAPLGTVTLAPKVTIKLHRATSLAIDKIKTFYFTFMVNNDQSKEFEVNNYWFAIKGRDGEIYKPQSVSDRQFDSVPPRSDRIIEVIMQTPKKVQGSDLDIAVIQWDFGQKDFQRKIGQFRIPKEYKNAAPPKTFQNVVLDDIPLRTEITRTHLSEDNRYQYVSLSMDIKNLGTQSITSADQELILRTTKGLQFSAKSPEFKAISIQPQDQETYEFAASIPRGIDLRNAQLLWIKKIAVSTKTGTTPGANAGGVNVPVALYLLNYQTRSGEFVPVDQKVKLDVAQKSVQAGIKTATAKLVAGQRELTISMVLTNESKDSANVPKYSVRIKTPTGQLYEVDTKPLDGVLLAPKISRTFSLTTTIPKTTPLKNLVMLVSEVRSSGGGTTGGGTSSPGSGDVRVPIATFALKFTEQVERLSSELFQYTDEENEYGLRIVDVDRLPYSNNDLIFIKIDVTNQGQKSVPLPSWSGRIWFDQAINKKTPLILLDYGKTGVLRPGETMQLLYRGTVPFTQSYQKMTIQIMAQEETKTPTTGTDDKSKSSGSTEDVLLAVDTRKDGTAFVAPPQTKYEVVPIGYRSEVQMIGTRIYSGETMEQLYTQLEWINLETRQIVPPSFYAFYRTQTGTVIPANVVHTQAPIMPQEKTLLGVKAEFPKGVKRDGLQLFIALGTEKGGVASTGETLDGYMELKPLAVKEEVTAVSQNVNNVVIQPYTISVQKYALKPTSGTTFDMDMTYRLEKTKGYVFVPNDRKLLIEVTDLWTNQTSEKEVSFESSGDSFVLGTKDINLKFSNIEFQSFQSYVIRFYEVTDRVTTVASGTNPSGTTEKVDRRKRLLTETVGRWFFEY